MKPIQKSHRRDASWLLVAIPLAVLLALTSGCVVAAVGVAAGAGAGTVAYVKGDLTATLNAHIDRATDATERAVADMQLAKISEGRDTLSASFVVRTAGDKKVDIKLTRLADDSTKIDIRTGTGVTGDDERTSRSILDRIKANL